MEDGSLCGLLTRPDIQSCKLTAFARFFPIFLDPFAPVCRICANPNLTCRSHVSTIIFCTYGSQERLNGRLVCAVNSAFLSDTLTIRGVQLLSVATPSLRLRGALKPAWRIPSGRAPQSTSEKKKAADRSAARERKPDASPYPPRCGDGPDRAMARKVAVSDDVSTGSSCVAPSIGRGDSHGTLCRYRCVVGSIECVRGGRERPDLARSEGGERTGCVGAVLQGTGLRGDTDRDRGLSAVAMAACRVDGGGFCGGAAGGASRQGGDLGDGGEDRPQRRARDRTVAADGLVSAGALQVAAFAGRSRPSDRAQAIADQGGRCGAVSARAVARLWLEDGGDHGPALCRSRSRNHCRTSGARTAGRDDVAGARHLTQGDRRAASPVAGDRTYRCCLPAFDDGARCWRPDRTDLQDRCRRSHTLHFVEAAGRALRAHSEEVPIRHHRRHRPHHQGG